MEDPPPQPRVALASGKGQSTTSKVTRVLFVLINLVFFVFGLFLIIRGSMEYYHYKGELGFWSTSVGRILKELGQDCHFVEKLNEYDFNTTLHGTIIGIGVLISLISLLGIVAFCTGSVCLICTYTCLLLVFACLELALGITGLIIRDRIPHYLSESDWIDDLTMDLKYYGLDRNNLVLQQLEQYEDILPPELDQKNLTSARISDFVDDVQKKYECCGVKKYSDWLKLGELEPIKLPNQTINLQDHDYPKLYDVPESSCIHPEARPFPDQKCGHDLANKDVEVAGQFIYTEGCIDVLKETLYFSVTLFSGIKLAIGTLMIFGILYACAVAGDIKNARSE